MKRRRDTPRWTIDAYETDAGNAPAWAFIRQLEGRDKDEALEADPRLARAVEDLVVEMKLEQQIVALREKRGLTQRQLAKLLGTSQPYVAKLESGRMRNLGVKTLVRCARALGASVTIRMEPMRRAVPTAGSRLRQAGERPSRGRPGRFEPR